MNITDFLLARIAEDEAYAEQAQGETYGWVDYWTADTRQGTRTESVIYAHAFRFDPARVLAECAAKRAIVEQHQQWPVLVESEPSELEQVASGLTDFTYRMTRQMAWLTTREYIKRFGVEPPTAPMLAALAAVYKDHPDYQQEWAL
jgi:hypothetical protein